MSPHSHRTIRTPTGGWSPTWPMDRGRRVVLAVTGLAGLFMTAAGVAALLAPQLVRRHRRLPPPHPRRPRRRRLPARHRGHPAAGGGTGCAARPARLGRRRGRTRHQPGAGPVRTPKDGAGDQLPPRRPPGGHPGEPGRRRRPRLSPQLRAGREDPTPPQQPSGGRRALHGPWPTDRPGHPGHGQPPGGRRVPPRRPPAGCQAPAATRPAGAVDPSPGSRRDRQDGPVPADTPPPWPGEATVHGHPDEPKTHSREARMHTGKALGSEFAFMAAIR